MTIWFALFFVFVGLTIGFLVGIVTAALEQERIELERHERIRRLAEQKDVTC